MSKKKTAPKKTAAAGRKSAGKTQTMVKAKPSTVRRDAAKIKAVRAAMEKQGLDHSGWTDGALLAKHDQFAGTVVILQSEDGEEVAVTQLELWADYTYVGTAGDGKPVVEFLGTDLNANPPTIRYATRPR